ncbi:MAG: PAS domain S-box protein [Rhodospirillaceae bacterium]|nr:PAS domain S-box protein [Rhodospirillaceae bacterium]
MESLGAALDLARVGLAVWDDRDRLLAFNEAYRTLVYPGLEHEVYVGRHFDELARIYYSVPGNRFDGFSAADMLAERLERRRTAGRMAIHHSRDRSFRVAETPVAGGGVIGVYIDVTEEHRSELVAREGEERLRLLFDNMRNIAYCHGQQGDSRTSYDQGGVRIYGRDAPAMFGTISPEGIADVELWHSVIHPDDRQRYLEMERNRRDAGVVYDIEFRFIHPVTGETRWAREVAWAVEDPQRGARSFDSYIIDVTESKQREDELAGTQAKLMAALTRVHQANRAKSAFLANMSHELRTPLNAIIGFAQMIAGEQVGPGVSPAYRDYANSILTGGQHLLGLINEILDLSKIEAGKMELTETAFLLREVVEEATDLMRGQLAAKGQALDVRIADSGLTLRADRQKLLQILVNVLGNAHKFIPAGGHIALRATRGPAGDLALEIEDDGPGMTPEEIETAWAPFGRVSDSQTTVEGTGLGLPLSRSFAELHGGALEIESVKGKGTILRLTLPAARVVKA